MSFYEQYKSQLGENSEVEIDQKEIAPEHESLIIAPNEPGSNIIEQQHQQQVFLDSHFKNNLNEESSKIAAGMSINGDIQAEGGLLLMGNLHGNISISGNLFISGHLEGNSSANNITAENAHIVGNMKSNTKINIGQETIILGNVAAKEAIISGAVKGDIDIQGHVIIEPSAIIMGNIKSKSVEISTGAVIEGMIIQAYAEKNAKEFFGVHKEPSPKVQNVNKKK